MLQVHRPPSNAAAWVAGAIAVQFAPGQQVSRFPAMAQAMLAVRLWPGPGESQPRCGPVRFHTLHTRPVAHHHAGAVGALGLILRPAAAAALLGRGLGGARVNAELDWADLVGDSEAQRLMDALDASGSSAKRLHALIASVCRVMRAAVLGRGLAPAPWIDVVGGYGAQAARRLGIGPRQLERRCQSLLGLSPKAYQSLVRFQRALALAANSRVALADVAAASGYFDQSHLGRDARRLADQTFKALRDQARPDAPWWSLEAGRQLVDLAPPGSIP